MKPDAFEWFMIVAVAVFLYVIFFVCDFSKQYDIICVHGIKYIQPIRATYSKTLTLMMDKNGKPLQCDINY